MPSWHSRVCPTTKKARENLEGAKSRRELKTWPTPKLFHATSLLPSPTAEGFQGNKSAPQEELWLVISLPARLCPDFLRLWKLVLENNEVRAELMEGTGPWSWFLTEILLLQVLALINAPFKPILEQEGGKLMQNVRIITAREPLERGREEKWKMKAGKWFKQTLTQGQWKGGTEGKWHNKNKCCKRKKSFQAHTGKNMRLGKSKSGRKRYSNGAL